MAFWAALWLAAPLRAETAYDLASMSLEDLMDIEVNLVSRSAGTLLTSPAAVHVLTGDDIRRSGAATIADALRLVPGMQVARIDASKWGITARGFNRRFAQKLLVLIDGRSVYTPLFSGVFWEVQDVLLEDVERIEVVRGPGATLWGANAVNGVINIVTRPADATQGALLQAGGGSEERAFAQARYGGALAGGGRYRVWAKGFARDAFVDSAGFRADDDWHMARAGFRADRRVAQDELSLQGAFYTGRTGQNYRVPALAAPYQRSVLTEPRLAGGHLLGHWQRALDRGRDLALQLYYDRTEWDGELFGETRDTYDIDFQHRAGGGRRELVWGLGWRHSRDAFTNSTNITLDPAARGLSLYSAFVQGGADLRPGVLKLTIGSKFEHNGHTGFEYQPNARLLWTPRPDRAVWAAAARAVRTPSRLEDDIRLEAQARPPGNLVSGTRPALLVAEGNPDFESERLHAFEAGARLAPTQQLYVDFAAYFNDYAGTRGSRLGPPMAAPGPPEHVLLVSTLVNGIDGETYGFELAVDWRGLADRLRLRAHYAAIAMRLRARPGVLPQSIELVEGNHPARQFSLWGSLTPSPRLELDAVARFVDELPGANQPADAYLGLDLRLAFRPRPALELALVGRDLLSASHPELSSLVVTTLPTEIQRSAYAYLSWNFRGE